MKKILFGLLILIGINSFGQTGFQYRRVNERIQGKFMVDTAFYLPRFTDTVQANLHKLVDTCGSMFFSYTKDSVYYRACNPKRWIVVGSGGGISDGDKGDITISGSGATFTIDNNVVSNAKLRQSAARSIIGNATNATANVSDVTANNNEDVLFRNGDVLQFAKPNLLTRQGGNQIGDLLVKTSLADTAGLTGGLAGSATYTISSNKLVVVQSGADYSKVVYDSLTSLDVINLDAVVSFNSFAGDSYVAQFGVFEPGFPSGSRYSIYGQLWTGTGSGQFGRMFIVSRDVFGNATTLVTSSSDLAMDAGDSVQVKFDKYENTITFSARNVTDNGSWITVTYTLTGTQTSHSVGNIGIVTGKNDYNIHQFKFSSTQVKNPDLYLFGDSKFTKGTYQNESLPALLKNNFGSVYANCAVGSTSADLMANRREIIDVIKPKKILIESSNDIRNGVSSGTWQANLTQLYNIFTAAGIEVYFTVLYETSVDQSAMDTWLTANYPAAYIRSPWVELQKYGTGILVDGIHLSAIGNKIVADALTLDGKLATDITDHFNYSTAALIPYNSSAAIVHIGLDTLVTSPTYGKLVRKTAGGTTPTLQQVLTAGSTLTSSNTINTGFNNFTINNINNLTLGSESGGDNNTLLITPTVSKFTVSRSSTTTAIPVLTIERVSTGTPDNGIGSIVLFNTETTSASEQSNEIISKYSNATSANRTSQFAVTGVNNAVIDTSMVLGGYINLTESSATRFTSTTIATGKIQGGSILVTIHADNSTDFQARTMRFIWSAVNKAGTLTITISTPEEVVALSSGTLTCTITATDGGSGLLNFNANAVSSLTQTTLRCSYQTFKNF